jgi:hypothetical protein
MLWNFGFRHHPELQTKWVKPEQGQFKNFIVWPTVDFKPDAAQMLIEEFPEIARTLANVTPANHREMAKEQGEALLEALEKLRKATEAQEARMEN